MLLKVIQTGYRILWVIQTGHMSEVIETGHMSEVIETGYMSKVIETGHMSEFIETGHMSEVIETGHMSEVIETGHISEVIDTGHMCPEVIQTGYRSARSYRSPGVTQVIRQGRPICYQLSHRHDGSRYGTGHQGSHREGTDH